VSPPSESRKARVAYYGGSFNPVHRGHLYVARRALRENGYLRLHFLPARCPPHKRRDELLSDSIRLELLRLATRREPRFVVDPFEIENPQYRYTFDTLSALEARDPSVELHFLIGGDSLVDLPKWYHAAELVERFTLVTAPRDPTLSIDRLLEPLAGRFSDAALSKLRANVLRIPAWPISASEIRAGLDDATLRRVLPRAVRSRLMDLDLLPRRGPNS